jgi:hypothetical protein
MFRTRASYRKRWAHGAVVLGTLFAIACVSGCSDDDVTSDSGVADTGIADQRVDDAKVGGDLPSSDLAPVPDSADDLPMAPDMQATDAPTGDAPVAGCPTVEPKVNDACAQPKLLCSYGVTASCGDIYECFGGKWALAFDGSTCGSPPPVSCPKSKPSGFCKANDPVCRYGTEVCRCLNVCSGQQPPPGQEYKWSCGDPQTVACPATTPKDGATCSVNGQVCNYGNCGGSVATCTNGKWDVKFIPPPP